jgi:hypothetical protein
MRKGGDLPKCVAIRCPGLLRADHPLVVLIRDDRTDTILVLRRIVDFWRTKKRDRNSDAALWHDVRSQPTDLVRLTRVWPPRTAR